MQKIIAQTFALSAQRPTVSIDHTDNYYMRTASLDTPSASDQRWQYVPVGGEAYKPTAALPYLWHKSITFLSDGSSLPPVIEFGGSLGQNGIDYDLVPSHSSILKAENGELTPTSLSCALVRREADGSATAQTTIPSGYAILVIKDTTSSPYTLGSTISTADCSVVTFVLLYGNVDIERHDIRVIAEGAEGIAGRGIQSQDIRFKANNDGTQPATPTSNNEWNAWSTLANAGYSSENRYLWRCTRTIFVDGNNNTETTYSVDGPTVWGTDGEDAITIDLDNEMDAIATDSTGTLTANVELETHIRLYRGAQMIQTGITPPPLSGIRLADILPTASAIAGVITIKWTLPAGTQLTADRYAVAIPVSYQGNTYTVTFTAPVVRSGTPGVSPAIYQLLLSQTEASFARNEANELTPASVSVFCGYTKNYNGNLSSCRGDQLAHLQNIDAKYFIFYRPVKADGSYDGNFIRMSSLTASAYALIIPRDTPYVAFEFVLSTASTAANVAASNIFDRETLPVNKDGLNGTPGESAFIIDIDNEMDAFGTDSEGKITKEVVRETTAKLFYGLSPLALPDLTCTKHYEDGTTCGDEVKVSTNKTTGKVTVTMGTLAHSYTKTIFIDISAVSSRGSKTARFTIQPQAAGAPGESPVVYQLMPTPSALTFSRNDDNSLRAVNNVLYPYVKVIEGETTTIKQSAVTDLRIYYGYGNPTTPGSVSAVGTPITVPAKATTGTNDATNYAQLVLELWRVAVNGSTITKLQRLDRETIPFNKEGEKGEPGEAGETAFIIDIDNEMTSVPVSQAGQVEKVTDIYFNLAAYYGTRDIINDTDDNGNPLCSVGCVGGSDQQVSVDVTTNKARPHIQLAKNFQPNTEIIELRFRVSHASYGTRDAVFSIAFVKAGGQGLNAVLYELLPSLSVINVGRDETSGAFSPATVALSCGYTKTDGPNTTSVQDCTAAFDGYDIYFRRFLRSSGTWNTTYYRYRSYKSLLASLAVGSYSKVQFIICKNTSATIANTDQDDSNVVGLIDRETIPVVADGKKGTNGSSAFIIDLDNEMDGVSVLSTGIASAAQQWTINAKAFYGTTPLTESAGVAFTLQGITGNTEGLVSTNQAADNSIANGVLVVNSSSGAWAKNGVVRITIRASHATYGSREAVFTLKPIFPGEDGKPVPVYNLLLSETEVAFSRNSSNALTPASVKIYCGYTKKDASGVTSKAGKQLAEVQSIDGKYNIFYRYITAAGAYGSWNWMKDRPTVNGTANEFALVIPNTTTYAAYEFILSSATGTTSVADANIIDRETLPIRIAAATGNGISVDDFYYKLTPTIAPPATTALTTANGWYKQGTTGCPTMPTQTNPYLWQCEHIEYSATSSLNKNIVKLVQVFNMGTQPNLLEQTAFDSENVMDKWTQKNGEVIPQARGAYNAYGCFPNASSYREMLKQTVFQPGTLAKISASNWYTLSFYSRTRRMVNRTSNAYGFHFENIYLKAGTYKLQFNGHISQAAAAATLNGASAPVQILGTLVAYDIDANKSDWAKEVEVKLNSTTDTTVTTGTLTVATAANYRIGFYAWKAQSVGGNDGETVTVNWWRVLSTGDNSLFRTFLYPSALAAGTTYFVDGEVKTSLATDGNVGWVAAENETDVDSGGWTHHYVTFQMKATITEVQQSLLFRIYNTYVEICQPKLEQSPMPTPWCEHEYDSDLECSHNPCGEWVANRAYFYCEGVRDVVVARAAATGGTTFFRLKRRTPAAGYASATQPYLDTEHWEKSNRLSFTATDLLLASEAYIKNLLLNYAKARDANGNVTVSIDGTTGEIDAKGILRVKALYTVEGGYKTVSGKRTVDLDANIGNSYVIPANTVVYLPDPTNYEGLSVTFVFQKGGVLGFDATTGIYMAYYTGTSISTVTPSGMAVNGFHSLDGLETITVQAIKAYGSTGGVRWTVTGQRGVLGVRSTPTGPDAYMVCPDGRLLI